MIDERNYDSAPGNTWSLEAPVSGKGWHGMPHICRVRHLHDFRCRLSFLCRKKSLRADSTGSSGNAHLLHSLSAVQQFDRPLCGKASGTRQAKRIPALMGAHDRSGRPLFVWHRPGMAPVDLRTRADHLHEPFWNNVLLAGWPARLSRYRWIKHAEQSPGAPVEIEVPASTAWPLVLAFGFTLMFAGLLTSASVGVLGVVLAVAGCVGWFREVFPHEHEEAVPIVFEDHRITTERRVVERVPVAPDLVRAWLPLETYPISAGLKGGLAGGVAMAVLACTYGLLKAGSIWYPINLLAATVYAESLKLGNSQLNSFHADSFAIALVLHGIGSIFVGLLYGAMLPMFARRPIVLEGLITPVLWSGLLYSIMQLLNPLLASRIDWIWFMASQIAFGAVAGIVVVRQERISTRENLPFLIRAGIEAPGVIPPRESGEKRP